MNPMALTILFRKVSVDDECGLEALVDVEASLVLIAVLFSTDTVGVFSEVTVIALVMLDVVGGPSVTRLADSSFCALPSSSWIKNYL